MTGLRHAAFCDVTSGASPHRITSRFEDRRVEQLGAMDDTDDVNRATVDSKNRAVVTPDHMAVLDSNIT
jgi:hypothetical protein